MQKKNIIYWITYTLFILFFVLGALFYRQAFIAVLILLFAIMPIISIFLLHVFGKKIEINITKHTPSVTVANDIVLDIAVSNKSIFPFLNCELAFEYDNLYYPDSIPNQMSLPAEAKKDKIFKLTFKTNRCGMAEFRFINITVTDFLHLYTIKLPSNITIDVPILPTEEAVKDKLVIPEFYSGEDEENFVAYGFPSQDIKEIRDYHPGDSLKSIHWKMTAKSEELVVKEFEQASSRTLLLLPELTTQTLEDTIVTLYSHGINFIKERELFKIILFNAFDSSFSEYQVENIEDLDNALLSLYYLKPYEMKQYALDCFKQRYGEEINVIHISGKKIELK